MRKKFRIISIMIMLMLSAALTACGDNEKATSDDDESAKDGELKLGEKQVTLATDTYVSNIGATHVVKQLLEEVGYNVTVKETDVGIEFSGLASGSSDASVGLWLPGTHASYWEEYKDKLDKMSLVTEEVELALTVPTYMEDINSIEDLANNKNNIGEKLEWDITGISPGAGMMEITKEKVIPSYGLDKDWTLQSSSGPAMAAELKGAIDKKEPIVVTLWTPHWTFNEFDLKMLEDPKNQYGDPDNVFAVSRNGFKEDSPLAYKIIDQFNWTKKQNQDVMYSIQSGMSSEEAAKKFLEKHPDLKGKWLEGIETEK
ncbi:glycine betaine ABC transporter substrate-binding protein [Lentibacillus cibarius]|uniref:Glycine betaine ABC transporter substrate-binding protein n=1 Tax=Lentibacillus cibarius TaxID=2583219 RepID=A0A549YEQ1_9BACI|nr:glycine betaine ABC transporter substrate-binding protein [Lentibacillus cibarius]TMN21464.1 glycine betaine ABC transporter substrate-binding protein [Lentibacillus cibarius]TRM10361.1 glycine betaine ABC transporter substrate-binding protein [Lentibacillus cibarius]